MMILELEKWLSGYEHIALEEGQNPISHIRLPQLHSTPVPGEAISLTSTGSSTRVNRPIHIYIIKNKIIPKSKSLYEDMPVLTKVEKGG